MSARDAGMGLLLALATSAAAATPATPSFIDAAAAAESGDHAGCADTMLAIEATGRRFPVNGELFAIECLSAAGRYDAAFAFLQRQLPGDRISMDDLRGKSRPGLDALRRQPGWDAALEAAERLERERASRRDETLRAELSTRVARDQAARTAAIGTNGVIDPAKWTAVEAIDRENTAWLRDLVGTRGWPGASLVGRDGAKAAWLLVQHADHDPAFQREALALMAPLVETGEADADDWAMLTDRVLLASGQPQRYGSQFETGEDGITRLRPVEDPDGLDARRAEVGLASMAEYRQLIRQLYGTEIE